MSRLIDANDYLYRERPVGLSDEAFEESHLYKSIMEQETVPAIPLDRVKQAREEIERNAYPIVHGVNNHDMGMTLNGIFQVLDKLIAEVEE